MMQATSKIERGSELSSVKMILNCLTFIVSGMTSLKEVSADKVKQCMSTIEGNVIKDALLLVACPILDKPQIKNRLKATCSW